MPAFAKWAAIPPPMVPAPMTTARAMVLLDNGASPVDDDGLAGDVAGGIRGEEDRHPFQFAGIADARDRVAALDVRLDVLDHGVREARVEEAGGDGVHADALRPPRRRELAGEADQR